MCCLCLWCNLNKDYTGCSLNIVLIPRILESLPPLPRQQHSASIGCTINYQPIGVTVPSHCVESIKGVEGVPVNYEKNTIFPEQHLLHENFKAPISLLFARLGNNVKKQ